MLCNFTTTAGATYSNQPAERKEIFNQAFFRVKYDLTNFTKFRLQIYQQSSGAPTSTMRAEYSLDDINFFQLEDDTAVGDLETSTTGTKAGNLANICAGAKTDVILRITVEGGNGVSDPAYRHISIQFI
jgi:hypothetical protein